MTHRFRDSITFSPTVFPGLLLAQQGEQPASLPAAHTGSFHQMTGEQAPSVSYLVALSPPHSAPTLWQVYLSYLWQRQESALGKIPVGSHFTLSHHSTPLEGFFLKRCFLFYFETPSKASSDPGSSNGDIRLSFASVEQSSEFCGAWAEAWLPSWLPWERRCWHCLSTL